MNEREQTQQQRHGPRAAPRSARAPCRARPAPPRRRLRQAERGDQRSRPTAAARVEQAGRRGGGDLVRERAGQPQPEEVGHQGEPLGGVRRRAVGLGQKLKDRVDRHRLDARDGVELLTADALEGALDHAVGALVAVVKRQAEQPRGTVEQAEVAAPRIDADAVQRAERRRLRQALERVGEQLERFQCRPSGSRTGRLGKRWTTSSEIAPPARRPYTHAAAVGAQIDGREGRLGVQDSEGWEV